MKITSVYLEGFRNFKKAIINFAEKSVVIGSNDIGKTNLLYAMRMVLDRSLSDVAIEPKDTDFYAHEPTDTFEIRIEFDDVTEECVIAKLKQHISDTSQLILAYRAIRQPASKKIDYKLLAGRDKDNLVEIDSRFYLKTLNLKYIGSKRDLLEYIRQERKRLLQDAKEIRGEDEITADNAILQTIEKNLEEIGNNVANLTYVHKATNGINSQLNELSYQSQNQKIIFDSGSSTPSDFVEQLQLASQIEGRNVVVGGDGRNNQIHLALWSTRNQINRDKTKEPLEVNLFCIEEPEAHLHPHQQRRLAQYLSEKLDGQVIMTTHSPHIASEVSPSSIIRLYLEGKETQAAGNGVNPFTEAAFIDFGYRLNAIAAETFFADLVFLVEGPSEQLFYKALAKAIKIDVDRLNVSILMVDGVGFKPYISLLASLRIPFVMRTDNDIFKIPKQENYRFAGIQRSIEIYRTFFPKNDAVEILLDNESLLVFDTPVPPQKSQDYAKQVAELLQPFGIFISDRDLENDLYNQLSEIAKDYFGIDNGETIVEEMQKRKATFMFEFLRQNSEHLNQLQDSAISIPLKKCQEIIEHLYGTSANS
ncbi:MAG TPA: AAA family ATPase [Leptospiraceae bacterium]|nr:AAA family ATPase [Leptospiraceae bacterium]